MTELKNPDTLSDEDIAALLPEIKFLKTWCNDIETEATRRATHGHELPGYKLVHGRSVRKWRDEDEVKRTLEALGRTPEEFVTSKLVGVTAVERLLGGKKAAKPVLDELTVKPGGRPTLAPMSDRRDAIKPSAVEDFSQ